MGLLLFRDYGLSVDENQQRDIGMISLKYVGELFAPDWVRSDFAFDRYHIPLKEFFDRDYGVMFETPVCLLERILHIEDDRNRFLLRHFCTFLVCFGGLIALYKLAMLRFRDWRLGLLAPLWLVLSPRLFAESFYNDKDAVFMAMFIIAANMVARLLVRPTVGRALWCALACACTIDTRIMGILLPMVVVGLLSWRALRAEISWARAAGLLALYLPVQVGLVVAFWPYLWEAPFRNFVDAYAKMSHFRWGGIVLYLGHMVKATDLPWHYSLVWMGITTPLLYVAAGLVGIRLVIIQLVRHKWQLWHNEQGMLDVLILSLFAGPILAVIILHSVLYDGWRQLYFVYPPLLLMAVRGWAAAAGWRPRWQWWPRALYGITALAIVVTGAQMVRDHPMQNVYFNLLAGPRVDQHFEMDYWGVGYRQDIEYIIAHENRPVVKVYAPPMSPGDFNRLLLPAEQRGRLVFVDSPTDADYYVTNYRWHPEPYPYDFEVFQLRADGRRVHSVFKLRW